MRVDRRGVGEGGLEGRHHGRITVRTYEAAIRIIVIRAD